VVQRNDVFIAVDGFEPPFGGGLFFKPIVLSEGLAAKRIDALDVEDISSWLILPESEVDVADFPGLEFLRGHADSYFDKRIAASPTNNTPPATMPTTGRALDGGVATRPPGAAIETASSPL
jgi:hypothetical protein